MWCAAVWRLALLSGSVACDHGSECWQDAEKKIEEKGTRICASLAPTHRGCWEVNNLIHHVFPVLVFLGGSRPKNRLV